MLLHIWLSKDSHHWWMTELHLRHSGSRQCLQQWTEHQDLHASAMFFKTCSKWELQGASELRALLRYFGNNLGALCLYNWFMVYLKSTEIQKPVKSLTTTYSSRDLFTLNLNSKSQSGEVLKTCKFFGTKLTGRLIWAQKVAPKCDKYLAYGLWHTCVTQLPQLDWRLPWMWCRSICMHNVWQCRQYWGRVQSRNQSSWDGIGCGSLRGHLFWGR